MTAERVAFRVALFQRRGLSHADAVTTADSLTRRDADRDDRRMCIECAHIQRGIVTHMQHLRGRQRQLFTGGSEDRRIGFGDAKARG